MMDVNLEDVSEVVFWGIKLRKLTSSKEENANKDRRLSPILSPFGMLGTERGLLSSKLSAREPPFGVAPASELVTSEDSLPCEKLYPSNTPILNVLQSVSLALF